MRRLLSLSAVLLALCLAAPPAGAQTKYIAFGDSITNPGDGDFTYDDPSLPCPEECGYPARLEDMLNAAGQNAEVVNAGEGGEDTQEALSRIDRVLDAESGDVFLLMEGTNDVSQGLSPETIRFNLNQLAQRAESRGLDVFHATVIPRIPDANRGDGDNVITQRLNWQIRDLAYDRNRELVDPFEVFRAQPNVFSTYYFPGGDAVGHPNAAGFDLLADIFFDAVTGIDSVPPVPGGVSPMDGAENVGRNAQVELILFDFGDGINIGSADLLINDQRVDASVSGDGRRAVLRYSPTSQYPDVVTVGYDAADGAGNERTRNLARFTTRGAQFLQGDVNQDGRVDGIDLIALARAFGSRNGESRYGRFVDLNLDNRIDGADLAILAESFGQGSL